MVFIYPSLQIDILGEKRYFAYFLCIICISTWYNTYYRMDKIFKIACGLWKPQIPISQTILILSIFASIIPQGKIIYFSSKMPKYVYFHGRLYFQGIYFMAKLIIHLACVLIFSCLEIWKLCTLSASCLGISLALSSQWKWIHCLIF